MPPTPKEQLALDFAAAMTKYSSTAVSPKDVSDAWAEAIDLFASSLGGGTATALATTGLSVNVSKAAPPAKGQVLSCTNNSPLEAAWVAGGAPAAHAATHQYKGGDEVGTATPAANAIPMSGAGGTLDPSWLPDAGASKGALVLGTDLGGTAALPQVIGLKGEFLPATAASNLLGRDATNKSWVMVAVGTKVGTLCAGDDLRLSDSRSPTAHAATHTNGTDDVAVMTGATSKAAGSKGLVGAPNAGDEGKFWKGDATWAAPTAAGADVFEYADGAIGTINAGNYSDIDVTGWFDDGAIVLVQIEAASATERTTVEIYGKDSFAAGQLIRRWHDLDVYNYPLIDRLAFHYADGDNSQELHIRIHNRGTVNSDYSIGIYGIGT